MKILIYFLLIVSFHASLSQPNCTVLEGTCKEACEIATGRRGGQGSMRSEASLDEAIQLCPDGLAYAYRQKSIPYLKRGDFVTWKKEMIPKITRRL